MASIDTARTPGRSGVDHHVDACDPPPGGAQSLTRKLSNAAVFERLDANGGRRCREQHRPPFDGVVTASELEHGTQVVLRCRYSNPSELRERLSQLLDDFDGP